MNEPPHVAPGEDHPRDRQIGALTEIIGSLTNQLARVEARVSLLANSIAEQQTGGSGAAEPAPWVWGTPAATVTDSEGAVDPQRTLENWVRWYNDTYTGDDSGRARPIPACWQAHPGLPMELATLAASWHSANIGPTANARDAQQWHHQWRPAFIDRMSRDWLHADCLDGLHRPTKPSEDGAPSTTADGLNGPAQQP